MKKYGILTMQFLHKELGIKFMNPKLECSPIWFCPQVMGQNLAKGLIFGFVPENLFIFGYQKNT